MKTIEFTLPDKCAIKKVGIRVTCGIDEEQAELAAEANGTTPEHELVDLSIVTVDGEHVLPGVTGYRRWPTKTRMVVLRLHKRLNGFELPKLVKLIEEAEGDGTEVVGGATQTKYNFPEGLGLDWVIFREMMEADERAAATAKKSDIEDEMVRRCIVRTNLGDEMDLKSIRGLDSRTRIVLSTYWNGMNHVGEDELLPLAIAAEAAEAKAEKVSAVSTISDSLENGSGSPMEADAA